MASVTVQGSRPAEPSAEAPRPREVSGAASNERTASRPPSVTALSLVANPVVRRPSYPLTSGSTEPAPGSVSAPEVRRPSSMAKSRSVARPQSRSEGSTGPTGPPGAMAPGSTEPNASGPQGSRMPRSSRPASAGLEVASQDKERTESLERRHSQLLAYLGDAEWRSQFEAEQTTVAQLTASLDKAVRDAEISVGAGSGSGSGWGSVSASGSASGSGSGLCGTARDAVVTGAKRTDQETYKEAKAVCPATLAQLARLATEADRWCRWPQEERVLSSARADFLHQVYAAFVRLGHLDEQSLATLRALARSREETALWLAAREASSTEPTDGRIKWLVQVQMAEVRGMLDELKATERLIHQVFRCTRSLTRWIGLFVKRTSVLDNRWWRIHAAVPRGSARAHVQRRSPSRPVPGRTASPLLAGGKGCEDRERREDRKEREHRTDQQSQSHEPRRRAPRCPGLPLSTAEKEEAWALYQSGQTRLVEDAKLCCLQAEHRHRLLHRLLVLLELKLAALARRTMEVNPSSLATSVHGPASVPAPWTGPTDARGAEPRLCSSSRELGSPHAFQVSHAAHAFHVLHPPHAAPSREAGAGSSSEALVPGELGRTVATAETDTLRYSDPALRRLRDNERLLGLVRTVHSVPTQLSAEAPVIWRYRPDLTCTVLPSHVLQVIQALATITLASVHLHMARHHDLGRRRKPKQGAVTRPLDPETREPLRSGLEDAEDRPLTLECNVLSFPGATWARARERHGGMPLFSVGPVPRSTASLDSETLRPCKEAEATVVSFLGDINSDAPGWLVTELLGPDPDSAWIIREMPDADAEPQAPSGTGPAKSAESKTPRTASVQLLSTRFAFDHFLQSLDPVSARPMHGGHWPRTVFVPTRYLGAGKNGTVFSGHLAGDALRRPLALKVAALAWRLGVDKETDCPLQDFAEAEAALRLEARVQAAFARVGVAPPVHGVEVRGAASDPFFEVVVHTASRDGGAKSTLWHQEHRVRVGLILMGQVDCTLQTWMSGGQKRLAQVARLAKRLRSLLELMERVGWHLDFKIDNVGLLIGESGSGAEGDRVQPLAIDFGFSALCSAQRPYERHNIVDWLCLVGSVIFEVDHAGHVDDIRRNWVTLLHSLWSEFADYCSRKLSPSPGAHYPFLEAWLRPPTQPWHPRHRDIYARYREELRRISGEVTA